MISQAMLQKELQRPILPVSPLYTQYASCYRIDPNTLCSLPIILYDSRITLHIMVRCTHYCILTCFKVMFIVGKLRRGISVI